MVIATPRVTLVAHTQLARTGGIPNVTEWMEVQKQSTDEETLTTFAGRACYQSFDRPNPQTVGDSDYLRRTLFEQGHWSIAEHASATFYITGVSRSFTHELIRHRHLSFSQLSQRFVDESEANIVIPPAARKSKGQVVYDTEATYDDMIGTLPEALQWWASESAWNYEMLVAELQFGGLPTKQAREAARAVLPNMTETRIVVTGNLRAWKEVIDRRTAPDADAEMQEVIGMVRDVLHNEVSPVLFTKGEENES